eukprot:m.189660 g.189660  ORF g.189660 m.189660 type:complete len:421 (+) comp18212_c0_seq5:173-1435(+)
MCRLAFVVLAVAGCCPADAMPWRALGTVELPHCSFVDAQLRGGSSSSDPVFDLYVTQFTGNPLVDGAVQVVPDVGRYVSNFNEAKPQAVINNDLQGSKLYWPNSISTAPPSALGDKHEYLVVPDGFLVPGKNTGGIHLIQNPRGGVNATAKTLTVPKKDFFYHHAEWIDINLDGRLDLLTARASKPVFGSSGGELLWLEQPASNPFSAGWKEHVITEGPDVYTISRKVNNNTLEVFSAEFFTTQSVRSYMVALGKGTIIGEPTVIDDTIGPPESLNLVDLNADGNMELLVNSHVGGQGGGVYAFTLPKTGKSAKYTLATGFPVTEKGSNQASPGILTPFFPTANETSGPPHILVAGDGSQAAYLMTPTGNFTYNRTTIVTVDGVIGQVAAADIDNDGYSEFFVPDYDKGKLSAYTFAPMA